jgi:hypothetical protein
MIFIGVDPGASGGLAWRQGHTVQAGKMPETEADIYAALRIFSGLAVFVVIEKVAPMPKQGLASTVSSPWGSC